MENSVEGKEKGNCRCPHHKMKGIFIALAGLAYLLGNLEIISMHMAHNIWPILIILFGLMKSFGNNICKCCTPSSAGGKCCDSNNCSCSCKCCKKS